MRDKNNICLKVLELAGWGAQALGSLDEAIEGSIPVSSDRSKDATGSVLLKPDREGRYAREDGIRQNAQATHLDV